MSIIWKQEFNQKEELPTTRFWLMCKMRFQNTESENTFNRRWDIYLSTLRKDLIDNMTVMGQPDKVKADLEKKNTAMRTIKKLEGSAYLTIPAEFLTQLGIPRVLRH